LVHISVSKSIRLLFLASGEVQGVRPGGSELGPAKGRLERPALATARLKGSESGGGKGQVEVEVGASSPGLAKGL